MPPPKRRVIEEIPEFKVKYKDVFHLRNLYVMMRELFQEEGWAGVDGDRWQKDIESMVSENIYQKGIHQGGKELWIWWRFQKGIEGRDTGYFGWTLDVDFHGAYIKDIEIIHDGKKIKATQGELEIMFRPRIIGDVQGTMSNHWLMKHFQEFYEEKIMHGEVEKFEKLLWRDVYKIQSKIKDFLNMRTYIPSTAPNFHGKRFGNEANF